MGLTIGCPSLGGKIIFMRAKWLCGISHNDSLFITHPWQSLFLWRIVNFINKKISLSLRLCIFLKLLSKGSERQTWDIWFQTSPFIESKFFQIHFFFFAVKLMRTSNFGLTSISYWDYVSQATLPFEKLTSALKRISPKQQLHDLFNLNHLPEVIFS